jgi:flagellar assembly protein FliH
MSDPRFAPNPLAIAMAKDSGFRPHSFDPVVRAREAAADAPVVVEPGEDPFAKGLAEGQRLAESAFATEREQLLALIAGTEALQDEPSEELAQMIAETVERLVRQIVADAPIDADWLKEQAETAAALVAEADKARTLWVHPQDAALLVDCALKLPVAADAAMIRGTVRIETSAGWIEHGRAVYLNELRAALGGESGAA